MDISPADVQSIDAQYQIETKAQELKTHGLTSPIDLIKAHLEEVTHKRYTFAGFGN